MDIQTMEKIKKMITELRTAEYLGGLASGFHLYEMQLKQAEKADEISYKILMLIYAENYKQNDG